MFSVFAVILSVFIADMPVYAAGNCSFTVNLSLSGNKPLKDEEILLYKTADLKENLHGKYTLSGDFADDRRIPDFSDAEQFCNSQNADTVFRIICERKINSSASAETDEYGNARFSGLSAGIYLAVLSDNSRYSISPFLTEISYAACNSSTGGITAKPKTVMKTETPEFTETKPAPLTTKPEMLPQPSKLPQTGQNNMPVPIMASAGATLIVIGSNENRRRSCMK